MGRLDREQRARRVVEEEVVERFVQLPEVVGRRQQRVRIGLCPLPQPPTHDLDRRLQVDHQVWRRHVRRDQLVQALVDEQLVVVEVHVGVDLVAIEEIVRDQQLAEEIGLAQAPLLPVTREGEEQLRLKRGTGPPPMELAEEGIIAIVEDHRRVEPGTKPLGKQGLPHSRRTFDGNVPKEQGKSICKVQGIRARDSGRGARDQRLRYPPPMAWFKKVRKPIESGNKESRVPEGLWVKCPSCAQIIYNKDLAASLSVCTKCGHHFRLSAAERLRSLFDGDWQEHDVGLRSTDPLHFTDTKPYKQRLETTIASTGLMDAVITATGRVNGIETVIAAMEYSFI